MKQIGVVTGIFESNPYEFFVRMVSERGYQASAQIEDIVKIEYSTGYGKVLTYGVIVDIQNRWDGDLKNGYEEDVALEGLKPAYPIYIAKVKVTRSFLKKGEQLSETAPEIPPSIGSPVFLVEDDEIDIALGFDELKRKNVALPVGILKNGRPAYLDLRYILGDNGAHINVSGQSGVAAKTSYTTFLVKSMMETSRKHEGELMELLREARYIIFNVKGESLMFLDRISKEWKAEREKWDEMYKSLDIEPTPFENVAFYAPSKRKGSYKPDVNKRMSGVKTYGWDTFDIVEMGLLELMFDPDEMARNQNFQLAVWSLQEFLTQRMEEIYQEFLSRGYVKDKEQLPSQALREIAMKHGDGLIKDEIPLDLDSLIEDLKRDDGKARRYLLSEHVQSQTISMLVRRLKTAQKMDFDRLWMRPPLGVTASQVEYRINWNVPGRVTVIDISKLRTRSQAFVVGAILSEVMREKETNNSFVHPVFIFLDELNKYAPRHGGGALANIFRDVAERGRSFRVILIGAEQTASEVDYRVITQAATVVVGRQKGAELLKPEYSHLTDHYKRKAALLKQGEVIVDQPFLNLPLTVKFPLPAWCTREDGYVMESENDEDEYII
ncbi:ATP-binding protein [Thermotoga sp. KOL6]|uniref:ATP-binding protein n=1 Tax=Thermotoga sp. KOL6 TaxID=126741 RepID=UPI000C794A7E|nr:ATP-binding protein [Thermotoga sp. KOL6]PLV59972.1 ATPase [Thermotoga sp. KOL6]